MSFLSHDEQRELLRRARGAIDAHLDGLPFRCDPPNGRLSERRAAFVTLMRVGALRGCIGTLEERRPLGDLIPELAISAATRDPRFSPLAPEERDGLSLEISVLTAPEPIKPDDVVLGVHGLIVQRGCARGVLLPQVAPEHGFTREQFLHAVCRKAGLPADAWRDDATTLHAFSAEVFGE